jgi:flagellar hook-associated protein 3 FlgL
MLFQTGANRIGELQSSLSKTQEQLAAGRRILTPSDDPVAAAQALELTQAQSINSQFAVNRQNVRSSLSLEESALQSITSLIQDVQAVAVSAGNGTLDNDQRGYKATELRGRLDELIGLVNTRDGVGNYIFSGYRTSTQPYAKDATGAVYFGDQGQRELQVGPQRKIAMSDTGAALFDGIKTGNGRFTTSAAAANTGSGVVSIGTVVDVSAVLDHQYEVRFTSATTYDIVDLTDAANILPSGTYTSGQAITFDGMQLEVTGSPAAGDVFSAAPSTSQSVFTTLTNLISALDTPVSGAAGKAQLANALNTANNQLGRSLDNVLTVRASVGARLKELDSLDSQGDDVDLHYSESLRDLQDLDYTKAITELSQQKIMLEAMQQAFVQTSGLTLFKFIS